MRGSLGSVFAGMALPAALPGAPAQVPEPVAGLIFAMAVVVSVTGRRLTPRRPGRRGSR